MTRSDCEEIRVVMFSFQGAIPEPSIRNLREAKGTMLGSRKTEDIMNEVATVGETIKEKGRAEY